VSVYYVDASAALKLLVVESHSTAFAGFYDEHRDDVWVSSDLLRIEVDRTVRRALPELLRSARDLLDAFGYLPIGEGVVEAAMAEEPSLLRSRDAIHLASARQLGGELTGLVTYDDRLAAAAVGLTVISPRG
jgi:predicted nucleic acid-binding protein